MLLQDQQYLDGGPFQRAVGWCTNLLSALAGLHLMVGGEADGSVILNGRGIERMLHRIPLRETCPSVHISIEARIRSLGKSIALMNSTGVCITCLLIPWRLQVAA